MTQEEKNLLLKGLYARLPYEVKGLHRGKIQRLLVMDSFGSYQVNGYAAWFNLNSVNFKPYLRPMSSMTEEEIKELENISRTITIPGIGDWYRWLTINPVFVDYLNSHYLDWRGLIPMGLALEAPEDMYKTK